MLVNRDEITRQVLDGDIKNLDDLNDVLRLMVKDVVETAMGAEMTAHLGYERHGRSPSDNSRNGNGSKDVRSKFGVLDVEVPRDRKSEFQPAIVKKRQTDISGIEDNIISMYAKGMTVRDIQSHLEEIYQHEISPETISKITDAVLDHAKEWQSRPLSSIYSIIFLDAIFIKVRVDGHVRNVAAYLMLGINLDGQKECLGIWFGNTESSKYWLGILNELKNRGVQDVLIFAVDGLNGFPDAIRAVYPQAEVQRCIVHQVRYCLSHVSWKHRKALATGMKSIYSAPTEEAALVALETFGDEWGNDYPHILESWQRHWDELAAFFKYPPAIRRLIYTTNPIESLNSRIKKNIKNRGSFPNEQAAFKLIYLAIQEAQKKWRIRINDWSEIYAQITVFFGERIQAYLR